MYVIVFINYTKNVISLIELNNIRRNFIKTYVWIHFNSLSKISTTERWAYENGKIFIIQHACVNRSKKLVTQNYCCVRIYTSYIIIIGQRSKWPMVALQSILLICALYHYPIILLLELLKIISRYIFYFIFNNLILCVYHKTINV